MMMINLVVYMMINLVHESSCVYDDESSYI